MKPAALPALTVAQLEYLVAVDEHRTWAEAAASLGVTPSALSQGLAELERRLGLALFARDGRQRRRTPAGDEVLRYATDVVARTAELAGWAERARAGSTGRVRIGMIDAAAVGHFADDLRRYRDERPDVDLRLQVAPSAELLEAVSSGSLDAAVVVEPAAVTGTLALEPLLVEPLRVYAPADAARVGPSGWGPWVLFPAASHTRALVTEALRRAGAPVDVVAESNQPEVLRAMVQLGLGWTVLPVAQAETGPDPLVPVRATPLVQRRLVLARRHGAPPDPAVDALRHALLRRSSRA
ncbi:MAG: LysR family transcriptional regulator [Acidimicrobiales bacterium]|nr:LysR family transcriptional regulator [Acidimicrobiales bacterium]MCB1260008.1 LysR family transcriptional regulator [Acidimicrobiales bacterium]